MNSAPPLPAADAEARAAALDISRSFCVQAPAGSGKTELLTQRILSLLAQAEAPESILAFTFTRKAAGEMRMRLLDSLELAATLPESAVAGLNPHKQLTCRLARAVLQQDAARGWNLLRNTQRLRVMTIDSFNHNLTARLPLSASMGGAANITEDIKPVFNRAIHDLFAELEAGNATSGRLRLLLGHLHNNLRDAEGLLQELLFKREQWLPLVLRLRQSGRQPHTLLNESLQIIVREQLDNLVSRLFEHKQVLHEALKLAAFAAQHLQDHPDHANHRLAARRFLPGADPADLQDWRALIDFLCTNGCGGFRKPGGLKAAQGFPAKSSTKDKALQAAYEQAKTDFGGVVEALAAANVLPLLEEVYALPDTAMRDEQGVVLNALIDLLPLLAGRLEIAMREAGVVDYTQTTLAALQALGTEEDPSELALKLDYRLEHILVDEFQDTSTIQLRLLSLLTRGWQEGDGRTLFVVGDGMQSCYGFRNARVSLFMQVRETGIGDVRLTPLDLTVNFRSDAAIVNAVNAIFSRAFPAGMDLARGGVPYSASVAREPVPRSAGISLTLWTVDKEHPADAAVRRRCEAEAVVERIVKLQQEDSAQHIAILVRNRRHLGDIVALLRRDGIRFNASEIDPLLSYPEISDLYALLKAVLNLADSVSWFALLRSPLVGLALEDIAALAERRRERECSVWSLWQDAAGLGELGDDARKRLLRTLPVMRQARERRQTVSLRAVLETAWLALGGPACISEPWLLPNLESFLTLMEAFDDPGDFNLAGFNEKLSAAYGNVSAPDVRLTIQTIHKAKGLEYDAVLIPGLHKGGGNNDLPLLQWQEYVDRHNQSHPLMALLPRKGAEADRLYDYLKREAKLRDAYEATRLLYIAVTRAARSAWLFAEAKTGDAALEAVSGTLLETIMPIVNEPPPLLHLSVEPYPAAEAGAETSAAYSRITAQPLRRLPGDWQLPAGLGIVPGRMARGEEVESEPQYRHLLARRIGDLVHLGLQHISQSGRAWLEDAARRPYFETQLAPYCRDNKVLEEAVTTVLRQLHGCLDSGDGEWLLLTGHREAASELALVDYADGYRGDHVIDRTFIDENGVRWIIDYKSSTPAPGQSLDAFIEAETASHGEQLRRYADLFRRMEQRPQKLALYFTALPLLHPLEDNPMFAQ